ncbi:MAG: sigma-70 family RNA polymerase sigma factor [Bryobacteraceae bacterium]
MDLRSRNKTDSDLIDGLSKRDPKALEAAYDLYGRVAYPLFLRITRNQSSAEDLVQELIRLWTRTRGFDSNKGSLGCWILSIARHLAIDYVRSAQARFTTRLLSLEDLDYLCFAGESRGPEAVIHSLSVVKTALSNLTPSEKRVLEMAYFEGCSPSEMAARLDEPLGTVKSWIRSGLGHLRAVLRPIENTVPCCSGCKHSPSQ